MQGEHAWQGEGHAAQEAWQSVLVDWMRMTERGLGSNC